MSVVSSAKRQKSWQVADEIVTLVGVLEGKRESLRDRLRELSRAAGWSDEDAAREANVSYRQYQRWLAGDSMPRTASLKKIAAAFGVAIAELLDEDEPPESQLDRIEARLEAIEHLLVRVPLTPEAEVDEIVREIEDEEPPGDQRGEEPRPGE